MAVYFENGANFKQSLLIECTFVNVNEWGASVGHRLAFRAQTSVRKPLRADQEEATVLTLVKGSGVPAAPLALRRRCQVCPARRGAGLRRQWRRRRGRHGGRYGLEGGPHLLAVTALAVNQQHGTYVVRARDMTRTLRPWTACVPIIFTAISSVSIRHLQII
jgi:hypothetical protein